MTGPRIAICFFGITRSLSYTLHSIERRVLGPAAAAGQRAVFCHFFDEKEIRSARSGEFGTLRPGEHALLKPDWLEIEPPDRCLECRGFETIKSYGDAWHDGFRSLRNLVHQLHSLDRVTAAALDWAPDIVIFARPDLTYHQSFAPVIASALACRDPSAFLPRWQHWEGGVNDRFAICTRDAAPAYGSRIDHAIAYCERMQAPLHAERLLRHTLESAGVDLRFVAQRASRTRLDGTLKYEDFSAPGATRLERRLSNLHGRLLRTVSR